MSNISARYGHLRSRFPEIAPLNIGHCFPREPLVRDTTRQVDLIARHRTRRNATQAKVASVIKRANGSLREPSRRPTLIPDLLELQLFDEKTGDAKRHSALDIDARPGRYTSQW